MGDFLVFLAFLGIQIAFTHSEVWIEDHRKQLRDHLKKFGWIIWLGHPHTMHACHEFTIFVIGRLAGG